MGALRRFCARLYVHGSASVPFIFSDSRRFEVEKRCKGRGSEVDIFWGHGHLRNVLLVRGIMTLYDRCVVFCYGEVLILCLFCFGFAWVRRSALNFPLVESSGL